MNDLSPAQAQQISDAIRRTEFFAFVWKCFEALHPGPETVFRPVWHVQAMCHELDAIRLGTNKRLVINVPPRHLKSITVSVAFVAFLLGHYPEAKIIVASYGFDLARKHSEDCRRVMSSAWYRRMFPRTRLASRGNTVDEIRTTKGGGRKAVSIGGAVTGHGADYIIIDDLMKASDAGSETELLRAQDYIQDSLLSRFDRPAEGRVVLIGQRLHERDPAGFLLEKGTYRHLNLPAIAEVDETIAIGKGRVHHRSIGEPLFPEQVGLDVLARMRKEMGSATFNCQYQQNPIAPDGSLLRWEWFQNYEAGISRAAYQMVVQSWDTGMSADPRSDFSVCTTWGFLKNGWHLLNVFRDRLDYPDLKRKVIQMSRDWLADRVLIEDAATGRPLIQECREHLSGRCVAIHPEKDKEVRFNAACAKVEEGKVFLPRESPWLAEFKRELQGFPRSRHDDQVDSFSQFLNWSGGNGFWRALGYEHPLNVERRLRRERDRKRR
ncbi:phage terminase large subunit [Sedimentimonas flavescens]|uniref:Phage terminase large subunit n=1 Tax=Sedimentimonas flavescens TaxID=2851012 RepID=A0ABT3A349_9RHOB|nr:phage terminase large subunit [Sedimentimonas flavescens]MBW0159609.1 phage terminase large subunit [Sedimentimonas flavescens]MCV2880371.1 phage terminase large subunit [Sedimentimonas flavescens]